MGGGRHRNPNSFLRARCFPSRKPDRATYPPAVWGGGEDLPHRNFSGLRKIQQVWTRPRGTRSPVTRAPRASLTRRPSREADQAPPRKSSPLRRCDFSMNAFSPHDQERGGISRNLRERVPPEDSLIAPCLGRCRFLATCRRLPGRPNRHPRRSRSGVGFHETLGGRETHTHALLSRGVNVCLFGLGADTLPAKIQCESLCESVIPARC